MTPKLQDDDDDEGPTIKDILVECGKRACDILCICDCCWLWIRCAEILSYLAAFGCILMAVPPVLIGGIAKVIGLSCWRKLIAKNCTISGNKLE